MKISEKKYHYERSLYEYLSEVLRESPAISYKHSIRGQKESDVFEMK
jgi:hypothetical protein